MKTLFNHLTSVVDEIFDEVTRTEQVKLAEVAALRAATPKHRGEVAQMLHKLAEDLRREPTDVTYNDLSDFLGARS